MLLREKKLPCAYDSRLHFFEVRVQPAKSRRRELRLPLLNIHAICNASGSIPFSLVTSPWSLPSPHRHCLGPARTADGLHNLWRKTEPDIFRHHFHLFNIPKAVLAQVIHHVLYQHFGR